MQIRTIIALSSLAAVIILYFVFSLYSLAQSVGRYRVYWAGQASAKGDITLVVLGDSAAQGIGASRAEASYVGLLAAHLRQLGKTPRIVNLSVSGATVADVTKEQLPQLKAYQPAIVLVEIGGNDVARDFRSEEFVRQYDELARQLPKRAIVANIPYFGGRIRKNNQAIQASNSIQVLADKYDLALVDLQTITKEKQSWFNYSVDFFHPNDRGYRNWEAAFWPKIKEQLARVRK